ncbi:hypothetical protein LOC70_23700 [Rhodopirellula sp. JC737]|nr:hypothetical protein [Rhodopirellula sp. JC737]
MTITSAPTGKEAMGTMSMENVKGLYQTQSTLFTSFPGVYAAVKRLSRGEAIG